MNPTVAQLVKKFPVYGTWRFTTAIREGHHCTLSWARWLFHRLYPVSFKVHSAT